MVNGITALSLFRIEISLRVHTKYHMWNNVKICTIDSISLSVFSIISSLGHAMRG